MYLPLFSLIVQLSRKHNTRAILRYYRRRGLTLGSYRRSSGRAGRSGGYRTTRRSWHPRTALRWN